MRFQIHAQGDRTVGDGDHHATVDIPFAVENDEDYREFVRGELRAAFSNIFDAKTVRVLTDEEDKGLANA